MSLTKNNNQENEDWPVDAAAATKFSSYVTSTRNIIPYFPAAKKNTSLLYHVTFNERTQKLVILEKSDTGMDEIVDIIDPKDVIGVDLKIEFPKSDLKQPRTIENSNGPSKQNQTNEPMMSTVGNVKTNNQAVANLNIYSYPKRPQWALTNLFKDCFSSSSSSTTTKTSSESSASNNDHRTPHHICLQLVPCEDFANIRSLVRAIRTKAKIDHIQSQDPLKNYLIVLNPYSGSCSAKRVYDTILSPMLEQCGNIEHDLLITTHAGHAQEHCEHQNQTQNQRKRKEDDTSSVVSTTMTAVHDVSKYDAIIAMGGDGILFEILQGLKVRTDYEELLKRIKFGIVGCGTCNGLAKSILHSSQEKYSNLESSFIICRGLCEKLDLSSYQTADNKTPFTSFLTFSWAIMADIDIEGEKLRWLGPLRCEIWAAVRAIFLRSYRARFSYLPDTHTSSLKESIPASLKDPIPKNWNTIEDDFVLFWASHVSHAGEKLHSSPHSKLNDGIFQIMVVRKPCTRFEMVSILLALETGSHVNHKRVEFIPCKAYRLEPMTDGSFNDLDGEVIQSGPIQARVQPSAIQMFHSGSFLEETK